MACGSCGGGTARNQTVMTPEELAAAAQARADEARKLREEQRDAQRIAVENSRS